MRYFISLSYRGTPFVGWQFQSNGLSVQQCIEETLSRVLRQEVKIVGCGRTDAGVHAVIYFAHFDTDEEISDIKKTVYRLNRQLPGEIAISSLVEVDATLHARHDAISRTYKYILSRGKNPFTQDLEYRYPFFKELDFSKMQQVANLISNYGEFFPFCKSRSGVAHYKCDIFHSKWKKKENKYVYTIRANRFLRGMVRLIVGTSLQVGVKKADIKEVKKALDQQIRLEKSLSVPAHGLYLVGVDYPEGSFE